MIKSAISNTLNPDGSTAYIDDQNVGAVWSRSGTLVSYTANTITIKHGSTTLSVVSVEK